MLLFISKWVWNFDTRGKLSLSLFSCYTVDHLHAMLLRKYLHFSCIFHMQFMRWGLYPLHYGVHKNVNHKVWQEHYCILFVFMIRKPRVDFWLKFYLVWNFWVICWWIENRHVEVMKCQGSFWFLKNIQIFLEFLKSKIQFCSQKIQLIS